MYLEISIYSFLLFLSCFFALKRRLLPENLFFILFVFIFFALSFVVRSSGFDTDIETYVAAMASNSFLIYYLKEPVIWMGTRWVYSLISEPFWVLVFFDIFAGLITYFAFRNLRMPQYSFFSILTFFPFVLGMQNVYRQWFSSLFLILAISFIVYKKRKVLPVFLMAVLSHNAAAIFFFNIFIRYHRAILAVGLGFSLVFVPFGILIGGASKSAADTNADLSLVMILLFLIILVFFILTDRFVVKLQPPSEVILSILIVHLLVTAFFLSSSTNVERLGMISLVFIYPFIVKKVETRFNNRFLMRVLVTVLGFVPLLLFSTRKFLLP